MDKAVDKIVKDVKTALESEGFYISKIILFGSYAHETPKKHSDIDLAAISDDFGNMNLLERLEFIGLALAKAKIMEPVEVRGYTEKEFKTKDKGTFVGDEIKAKGIEIL